MTAKLAKLIVRKLKSNLNGFQHVEKGYHDHGNDEPDANIFCKSVHVYAFKGGKVMSQNCRAIYVASDDSARPV